MAILRYDIATAVYENNRSRKLIVDDTFDADDQWTDWVEFEQGKSFTLIVSGSFTGTPVLQVSFDDGVTWYDVWTGEADEPATKYVDVEEGGVLYRLGFPTGALSAGSAYCRMSQSL